MSETKVEKLQEKLHDLEKGVRATPTGSQFLELADIVDDTLEVVEEIEKDEAVAPPSA